MAVPGVDKLYCKAYKDLPINMPFLLTFRLKGTYSWLGMTEYTVKLSSSNRAVTLTTQKVSVEEAWKFLTNIEASKKGSTTLRIHVDGTLKESINFRFLKSKDVFQKTERDKMIDELEYIEDFADAQYPGEYAGNYCMQAAERGLSELLDDDKNFYSVERDTHRHKNRIGFSGKSAYDRGKTFVKKGFVEKVHTYDKYKVNVTKKDLIFNAKDEAEAEKNYKKVRYDIIELSAAKKQTIKKIFEDDMANKEIGYHIYYFTVTDGFHTLILELDNFTDPCNPKYIIWDQHGKTSSKGPFDEIAEGIRRQTSWTFANSCLNRYKKGKTKYHDSTKMKLWKIKMK